jgi:hypothetical protein
VRNAIPNSPKPGINLGKRTYGFIAAVGILFRYAGAAGAGSHLVPGEVTRVPLAANVVSGMINLRNQIVCAIDLRRRLGLHDRPQGQLPMNAVVRTGEGAVSLRVDEIGDVIEVEEETLESSGDAAGLRPRGGALSLQAVRADPP